MGHAAVLVRGPASVPWDVRRDQPEHSLSLEAECATSSTARQEDLALTRRHDAAVHAGHRRAVPERGDDRGLVLEWLDAKGLDVRPGKWWVRRLLHGTRLSHKKPAKCLKELHSPALQEANTHRLFIKLCWLMDTHAVGADRVVNIDETSCRVLPAHLQGNTKEATTFTIAFSMDRGPRTRARQTPSCRRSPGRSALATSHRRTATTTTILQFAASLDDVINPSKEGQSWILLWDMASIHASEGTMTAMKEKFPHVVLCFLPPRSTSYLQPCDMAVFKSCIQTQASATLAPSVLNGSFKGLAMNKAWRRQSSADWAARAVKDLCAQNKVWNTGWHRLRAGSNAEFREDVAEAAALHAHDALLQAHRAGARSRRFSWNGPWQKRQTTKTTRPCQTRRLSRR